MTCNESAYDYGDRPKEEEESEEEWLEEQLQEPCPACGIEYRGCDCLEEDPFEDMA